MTLTGPQVCEACRLLRWTRFDLQRRTALPLVVIDRALNSAGSVEGTLADDIILKDALHRAGVDLIVDGRVRLREG